MTASSKKKKKAVDQNALNAGLLLGMTVLLMFNLIQYGAYQEQREQMNKTETLLQAERLKRDYFEWRESKAIGHTTAKTAYPRWQELEELGVTK